MEVTSYLVFITRRMSQESEKDLSLLVCTGRSCRERQSEYILKRLGNDFCSLGEPANIEIAPTLYVQDIGGLLFADVQVN